MNSVQTANFKRILVAVDGSEHAKRATLIAAGLAKSLSSELILLHVATVPVTFEKGDVDVSTENVSVVKSENSEILEDAAREAERQGITPKKVMKDNRESVSKTILDYSEKEGVDLIVIATRGLGGFERLLLGSVASALINHARCSVLIAR